MSTTLLTGFNIANVERVRVTTEETTPKTYMYRTMTSFDAEPYVNEGEEVTQRVKNTIMGRIKTDDLLEGYDISCEDERLIPQVLALVDGGTYDDEEQSYAAPAIGTEVVRTPFTLDLYTSDRGGGRRSEELPPVDIPALQGQARQDRRQGQRVHQAGV